MKIPLLLKGRGGEAGLSPVLGTSETWMHLGFRKTRVAVALLVKSCFEGQKPVSNNFCKTRIY